MDDLSLFIAYMPVALVLVGLWLLPVICAIARNHCSFWGILVANVIFGWVPILWPVILIWSLSGKHESEKRQSA